jgi:hypothetical protein
MTNHHLPEDFETLIEQRMGEMFEEASKVQGAIDEAYKAGKNVTSVMGPPDVKIGDIIDVMKYNPENPEGDENTKQKARVLHASPVEFFNPENRDTFPGSEVIVVLLDEGDLTTEDEFKAMYGEEADDEVQEASEVSGEEIPVESVPSSTDVEVTVEPVRDSNECECGADREMCMRNQDLIGLHINES